MRGTVGNRDGGWAPPHVNVGVWYSSQFSVLAHDLVESLDRITRRRERQNGLMSVEVMLSFRAESLSA